MHFGSFCYLFYSFWFTLGAFGTILEAFGFIVHAFPPFGHVVGQVLESMSAGAFFQTLFGHKPTNEQTHATQSNKPINRPGGINFDDTLNIADTIRNVFLLILFPSVPFWFYTGVFRFHFGHSWFHSTCIFASSIHSLFRQANG